MIRILLLAAALAASALPAAAQSGRDLARISAYLNALDTARGDFIQIAPDGETSDGRFYINRPGRIRFEYTPPNPGLVVSDGTFVVIYDLRDCSNQTTLLSETPLDLLLRERVNLAEEGAVRSVERSAGQMRVTAQDPDNPDLGSITLVFAENPLELRQWVVTDASGQETTVALSGMERNVPVESTLFLPRLIEQRMCKGSGGTVGTGRVDR